MKLYPLEAIRSLRKRKEDEADRKLAAARVHEQRLVGEVKEAQKKLEEYLLWIERESERLFKTILGELNPIHKITEITQQIGWNRSQQATYVVAIEEAQKKLEQAQEETALCLEAQQTAYKEVWKIDQHREFWLKEERLLEEQAEEADLEEIAATIFAMREQEE